MGCEGPIGPPGIDAEGVDITPPTIALTSPHPLDDVWDEFKVAAAAVDNVAIREVVFMFDGSQVVNGVLFLDNAAPYELTIEALGAEDARLFTPGWHFVAARAYDIAGNIADSPLLPIKLGYSDDLQDTVSLAYHNSVASRGWTLPDTAGAVAYWSRFRAPKRGRLLSVDLMLGGRFSDSTTCMLKIMTGTVIPSQVLLRDTLDVSLLSGEPAWRIFDLGGDSLNVQNDFFVVIDLSQPFSSDSLVLMSDDGLPPWQRCGSLNERGYNTLDERYGAENNFLISCKLYFTPPAPPDTTDNTGRGS